MIDLHAHILPGLDDGPYDLDGSVALARAVAASGTGVLAATSHVDHGFGVRTTELAAALAAVRARLAEEAIGLEVIAGGEIAASRALDLGDDELLALRLGGGPTLLLEAPLMPYAGDFEGMVDDLQTRGHRVLIGHPERSPLFQRAPERLARLVDGGALAQITAGSLLGEFSETVRRFTVRLLRDELVHVIASDCHDPVRRPPGLRDALAAVEGDVPGASRLAEWMTEAVPAAVLTGEPVPERPDLTAAVRRAS